MDIARVIIQADKLNLLKISTIPLHYKIWQPEKTNRIFE